MNFLSKTRFVTKNLSKRNSLFPRLALMNSTVADANAEVAYSKYKNDSVLLFPWRERPSGEQQASNVVKLLSSRSVLAMVEKEEEFLEGANGAFQCAVESIFRHPILRNHIFLTQDQLDNGLLCDEAPVIDVVLEDRLAKFYEDAISNFVSHRRFRLAQQLVSINKYHIVSGEILFYSEAMKNREFVVRHPQKPFGVDVLKPQHEHGEERTEIDRLLLRLWVDFECSEIFCVKNVDSGEITQGSENVNEVVHQILLESSIQIPRGKDLKNLDFGLASEWKLVDIDHWMDGNNAWIQNTFQL